MMVRKSNKFGSVAVTDLERFEQLLGAPLSADYRDFLLKHNGGTPYPKSHFDAPAKDAPLLLKIHYLYGLTREPEWASIAWHREIFTDRILPEALAIGCDEGGNQIVLILRGNRLGQVYFWDHELETDPPGFRNMTLLANSFTDLVRGLYEFIDPKESAIDRMIENGDVTGVNRLLDGGYDIEATDEYDRTMMENAAIHNQCEIITALAARGAVLRRALGLAEANLKFFPEHQKSVELLRRLSEREKG
jgi:hypothetical protein